MNKTPEAYFHEKELLPEEQAAAGELSSAEKAFLEKYLGLKEEDILDRLGMEAPADVRTVPLPLTELPKESAPPDTLPAATKEAPLPEPPTATPPSEEIGEKAQELAAELAEAEAWLLSLEGEEGLEAQKSLEVEPVEEEPYLAEPEPLAEELPEEESEETFWAGDDAFEEEDEELGFHAEEVDESEGLAVEEDGFEAPATEAALPEEQVAEELPEPAETVPTAQEEASVAAEPEELGLDELVKTAPELQLVSFFVGNQEFTLPIQSVKEVIRYVPPTQLPGTSAAFAGVINLRGRVTPIFRLHELLELEDDSDEQKGFIVVCQRKELQIGLIVRNVSTIYRVPQERIEWNIEAKVGTGADVVAGVMKTSGSLVGIFSADTLFDQVVKR